VGDPWRDEPWEQCEAADHLDDNVAFDGLHVGDDINTAEDSQPMSVTVTNPSGTVSATVLIDGGLRRVDLAPRVAADMTESELAEEILLIARLARENALAGQHLLISATLQRLGHDPLSTRSILTYQLGLPSVETALAEKTQAFATRYDHED
jgi:ESX secretion-associated protein EspD/H